jgi:hypothetical protein
MSNTVTLYRGISNPEAHAEVRSCWTQDREAAESYGETILEWVVDLDEVTVLDAPAYDRDEDFAPGDTVADCAAWAALGAQLIRFDDEDCSGNTMETFRVVGAI